MSEPSTAVPVSSPLMVQALRFGRSLIVGGGGSLADFAAVFVCLRIFSLDPTWARVAGLGVGCLVMFYGSRSYAFRAQSGSATLQAKRFIISEAIAFPLNLAIFKLLVTALPGVPAELLSVAANFALFLTYYYPVRSLIVFRTRAQLIVRRPLPAPT